LISFPSPFPFFSSAILQLPRGDYRVACFFFSTTLLLFVSDTATLSVLARPPYALPSLSFRVRPFCKGTVPDPDRPLPSFVFQPFRLFRARPYPVLPDGSPLVVRCPFPCFSALRCSAVVDVDKQVPPQRLPLDTATWRGHKQPYVRGLPCPSIPLFLGGPQGSCVTPGSLMKT